MKKILFTLLFSSLFWSFSHEALAAIQLDPNLRPEGLPTFGEESEDEEETAESEDPPEDTGDETPAVYTATQTLVLFIGNIVSQVLLYAGAVSIIFLIVAGANYIFAFGKDERIEKGKRGIFWAITGLFIILLSYAIVRGLISLIVQVDVSAT